MHEERSRPRTRGNQAWQEIAACAVAAEVVRDPDLFFPLTQENDERVALAKKICSSCQIKRVCLEAALDCGDVHGIRGGLTARERKSIRHSYELRCDSVRVAAALSGKDVHLTVTERQEFVRLAVGFQTPASRVAEVLKITEAHAKKLFRREYLKGLKTPPPEASAEWVTEGVDSV